MATTHPAVDLHVDGVQVLVGSPDVDVFDDGTDADSLRRRPQRKHVRISSLPIMHWTDLIYRRMMLELL